MSKPKFVPGDMIELQETHWPAESTDPSTLIKHTGIYETMGLPVVVVGIADSNDVRETLRKGVVGTLSVGDRCLIVATGYCETDGKWYYLLNNGRPHGLGWTRCAYRMKKL